MGKSIRKYRQNREYDYLDPDKASAYAHHDGRGNQHFDNDLLTSPREFVPLEELAPGHSSPFGVMMNLTVTCVGTSVVVMPYVFLQAGFVMTIFMMMLFAIIVHYSTYCLVHLGVSQGIYSLHGLAKLAFGQRGAYAVGFLQFVTSLGLVIAYLSIIYEDLPVLLGQSLGLDTDESGFPIPSVNKYPFLSKLLASRFWFAEVFTVLFILPIALMLASYRRLQYTSGITTVLLLLTALCVMSKASYFHDKNVREASSGFSRDYLAVPATIFQAFGTMASSFASQHHIFHAFHSLRERTVTVFMRVSLLALFLSVFLAYSVGIGGYVSYLSQTKADIFQNLDFRAADQKYLRPFWFFLPLCAVFCIPLEVLVTRHSMQFLVRSSCQQDEAPEVLFRAQPGAKPQDTEPTATTALFDETKPKPCAGGGERCSWMPQLLTAVAMLAVGQMFAFFALSIGVVLSVTGGIGALLLMFVLPAACHLKLSAEADDSTTAGNQGGWFFSTFLPCFSLLIGIIGSVACVLANIVQLAS
ncbi:TPA: hypothetical protein N0F65_012158 [Lagenidium giganteum]|uniref:Amino acid transporter transmembrane domain-containing protein n=1 Tax=Lagenidium giganteum TaxID=4803 RepID=A0AAV2YSH9_9STRA|nr:TPA: hypothetical protein N0F65_012158 [Lagenidium giganteum]